MLTRPTVRKFFVTCVAALGLCCASEAFAQFGGNAGATGGGATGNTGGRTTGGGGAQGQTGINVGQELGTQNLNQADGSLSAQVGQNAFIGQGNDGFIGNRFAGQANTGQAAQFGNLGQTNNNRLQNQVNTQRKQMRPQLRIGFDVPARPTEQVRENVSKRVITFPRFAEELEDFGVTINEAGVATLKGRVEDEHTRRLLAAYVRMEPGIRDVVNELQLTQ